MLLTNVILENKTLEGKRLELSDKDSIYFLGPNLTLKDCTIITKTPTKRLLIKGVQFINCAIEVKQELKNFRWADASLSGCQITGRLWGNDFGHQNYSTHPASIEDCDFTGAQLDGCRFMSCDISTLRLPRWPCFTLLEPFKRSQELSRLPWPSSLRFLPTTFDWAPSNTSAVTFFTPTLVKKYNASEQELRAFVERMEGVIY
jgi:hypothetical protein